VITLPEPALRAGQTLLFVAGLHRSGTSLIARALSAHPDISGLTGTGVPEDEGQHLQRVVPTARAHGGPGSFAFDRRAHLTESSPLATSATRAELLRAWAPYWDLSRQVLVEKSPPNLVRTRLLQAVFPEARFVVVLRHPLAVSYATQRALRRPVHRLVDHWLAAYECFAGDLPALRQVAVVRYEHFVARPETELERLLSFAGAVPAPVAAPAVMRGVNDAYLARWRHGDRVPGRRAYRRWIARRADARTRALGYALDQSEPLERAPALGA
jgi:hypothetical protein